MIAVVWPVLPVRLGAGRVRGRRVVRSALLFVLDVLAGLGLMVQPAFWSAVALAVAAALGQAFVSMGDVAFGGFVVGSLSVCVVAGVLVWAEYRHRWWSRPVRLERPAGGGR